MTGVVTVVAVLSVAPAVAQMEAGQNAASPELIATEHVGGTLLTIRPAIPFERASLRVSGPEGYALRKMVRAAESAGPITVDLLADARQAEPNPLDLEQEVAPPELERLVDGIYKYEAVFYDGAGGRRVHTGRQLRSHLDADAYPYRERHGRLFVRDADGLMLEIEKS